MYKQRGGLSSQPIHQSALRAALSFLVGGLAGIGIGGYGCYNPNTPLLGLMWVNLALITIGIASILFALRYWLLYKQIFFEFRWLSGSRFYTFVDGIVPYLDRNQQLVCPWSWKEPLYYNRLLAPLGMALKNPGGKRASSSEPDHDKRWIVEWPAYRTRKVSAADGTYEIRQELLNSPHNAAFVNRAQWLAQHHPERHARVITWWQVAYKQTSLPQKNNIAYVQYLAGANIACEPTWWKRKYSPSFDFLPYQSLQHTLLMLPVEDTASPPALPTAPIAKDIFIAKGFMWEPSHLQKYAWHLSFDKKEAGEAPNQGDARAYALGIKDETMIFRSFKELQQHLAIYGATGVGKTRLLQSLCDEIIRSGHPLIIIDPKGDEDWQDHVVHAARAAGRGHQLRLFNLVLPENHNFATMNPLSHYNQAEYLGPRATSSIDATSDPFFKQKAIAVCINVLSAADACLQWLQLLGRDRITGELLPRDSEQVPVALLAMQWAGHHPGCTPQQAEAGVLGLLANRTNPTWRPNPEDVSVLKLASMAEYTPAFWCPALAHVSSYALEKTHVLLALFMKISYFHAFLEVSAPRPANTAPGGRPSPPQSLIPPFAEPDFHNLVSIEAITGKSSSPSVKPPPIFLAQIFREAGTHPIELHRVPHMQINPTHQKWIAFYDYFIPPPSDNGDPTFASIREKHLRAISGSVVKLVAQIPSINAMCELDRSDFLQQTATLESGLASFKGAKERIVSARHPDVVWSTVIKENQIVYCNLGSLIDKNGASGFAKMAMADLMSYAGEVYHFHQRVNKSAPKPFFLMADEIGRWLTDEMVEMAATVRGAGGNMLVGGQTRADIVIALGGDHNNAQQFESNINSVLQLRAAAPEDAEAFAKRCGKRTIIEKNTSSRLNSDLMGGGNNNIDLFSGDLTISLNKQSVDLVSSDMTMSLPQGQALYSALGGNSYLCAIGQFPQSETSTKDEFGTLNERYEFGMVDRIDKEIQLRLSASPTSTTLPATMVVPTSTPIIAHVITTAPAPVAPTIATPVTTPVNTPTSRGTKPPFAGLRTLSSPSASGSSIVTVDAASTPSNNNVNSAPNDVVDSAYASPANNSPGLDSTVGLPSGSPSSVHIPKIPTTSPQRSDSIGNGSPFSMDD